MKTLITILVALTVFVACKKDTDTQIVIKEVLVEPINSTIGCWEADTVYVMRDNKPIATEVNSYICIGNDTAIVEMDATSGIFGYSAIGDSLSFYEVNKDFTNFGVKIDWITDSVAIFNIYLHNNKFRGVFKR